MGLNKDEDESESESDNDEEKGDNDDRNVYELFEDVLGDCDVEKCALFERNCRLRYDDDFEKENALYYALNEKEQSDWFERVQELQYQRRLDSMHILLFHTSAR